MSSDFFKISKGVTLTPQASEPTGQNGDVYYNTTLNKFRKFENGIWKNLAGEGSGFKNILSEENSKFEAGVQDWVSYDDGAVSIPVDGTGGSPSAITRAVTTTGGEVLEDLTSLKISKSASDGQGEGVSVLSKTIDRADRGKPFFVYFSYDATHANFVPGDLKVYAYDVTNSKLLNVYNDFSAQLLKQRGQFSGVIYTEDTTASVRLIVHCATTSALAYDIFIDEVVITPQATITGPVITDWQAYTPTFTGFGTVSTQSFRWRRVGDSVEIQGRWTNGTVTATEARISLPTGLISSSSISTLENCGMVAKNTSSGYATDVLMEPSVGYVTFSFLDASAPTNDLTKITGSSMMNTGDIATLFARIPIQGWSAGASLTANDAGLQTVRLGAYKNGGSVTANTTIPSWTGAFTDNYSAFNLSTGVFTVPRTGDYYLRFAFSATAGGSLALAQIRVNGTVVAQFGGSETTTDQDVEVSTLTKLNKGDLVTFTLDQNKTAESSNTGTQVQIFSLPDFNTFGVQGPIVVGAQTDWTAFTPSTTQGFGSITNTRGFYKRIGDSLLVNLSFTSGTTSGTEARIDLPDGLTVSSLLTQDTFVGEYMRGTVTGDIVKVMAKGGDNYLTFALMTSSGGGYVRATGSQIIVSGQTFGFFAIVPIAGLSSETRLYPTQRVIGTTYLKDVKAQGTNSQTLTTGTYVTKDLNTQEGDTGFCSLSSNQFTLQPGTYEIEAVSPCNSHGTNSSNNKAKLRNITDSTNEIFGSTVYGAGPSTFVCQSIIKGRLVLTSAKTFEIQHRITTGSGAIVASNFAGETELYTIVKIDKIY